MRKFVLDTNLYIAALRGREASARLLSFEDETLPRIHFHAVVAQELLAGAVSAERRRALYHAYIRPFDRRRRLVTPSFRAWRRAGEVVSELVERGTFSAGGFSRSSLNDVLLAASCREEGLTLVTANTADFAGIAEVEPFDFAAPWPAG